MFKITGCIALVLVCSGLAMGVGIQFPSAGGLDDFDYGRSCPNAPPDYCGCTGDQGLMEENWHPASELGLIGWSQPGLGGTETATPSAITGGELASSFINNCATGSGFRGSSPPLALKFPAAGLRMNYLDLGAMAAAIDPTKNAVNGTDANPLLVRVSWKPNSNSNSQYMTSSYIQLFAGTDVAPVVRQVDDHMELIKICRDNTTGYAIDSPSGAIAFGYRGGKYGGMSDTAAPCAPSGYPSTAFYMYRHVLYDGRRWMMLKDGVPHPGDPSVETGTKVTTLLLTIKSIAFDVHLEVIDASNVLHVYDLHDVSRNETARHGFQYLAVGSSSMTETAIYVDDVAIGGNDTFTIPGGELEYYLDPATSGACCKSDHTCEQLAQGDCAAIPGATYQGSGTTCGVGMGRCCAVPFADSDHDGDVDMDDFARLQTCLTTGSSAATITDFSCRCFDTDGNDRIDAETDVERFIMCASGPTVPAVVGGDCVDYQGN